jgi:hypothetical protein
MIYWFPESLFLLLFAAAPFLLRVNATPQFQEYPNIYGSSGSSEQNKKGKIYVRIYICPKKMKR